MTTVTSPPPAGNCDTTWEDRVDRRLDDIRELVEEMTGELAAAVRGVQVSHAAEWLAGIGQWPGGTRSRHAEGRPKATGTAAAAEAVAAAEQRVARDQTLLAQAVAREAFVRVTERFHEYAYMIWPGEGLWPKGGDL